MCNVILAITLFATLCLGQDEVEYAINKLDENVLILEEKLDELKAFIREVTPNGDCDKQYRQGERDDGIYVLPYIGHVVYIYCQFNYQNSGKNWMVFQRRMNGGVDFYRNWNNYTEGFGNLNGEFWFGLTHLYHLAGHKRHILRVDMEDFDGNTAYAEYSSFFVGDSSTKYKLSVSGYSGTAGDSMTMQSSYGFSTYDQDNDAWDDDCSASRGGAWWYKSCTFANLNGEYYNDGTIHFKGIFWYYWKDSAYSLKSVEMKMRPSI